MFHVGTNGIAWTPTHTTPNPGRVHLRAAAAKDISSTQTLHLGRNLLRARAAKEGSVSRPLITQAFHSISVGFTYELEQRRMAVLAGHPAPSHYTSGRIHLLPTAATEGSVSRPLSTQPLHSILVGFTYLLQLRRRVVLAGHSAPRHYTLSRSDSLTRYRSKGWQC